MPINKFSVKKGTRWGILVDIFRNSYVLLKSSESCHSSPLSFRGGRQTPLELRSEGEKKSNDHLLLLFYEKICCVWHLFFWHPGSYLSLHRPSITKSHHVSPSSFCFIIARFFSSCYIGRPFLFVLSLHDFSQVAI